MLNLLIKDFKLMFVGKSEKPRRILYFLSSALFVALFVALETFLYSAILKRLAHTDIFRRARALILNYDLSLLVEHPKRAENLRTKFG